MTPQDEISVEDCIKFVQRCHIYVQQYYGGDVKKSLSTIAHLRRLQEVEVEQRKYFDLLAVVHRDGGHYREANGTLIAIEDAILVVAKDRAELEKCRRDAERYRWILEGVDTERLIVAPIINGEQFQNSIDAAISAGEGKDGNIS